jgi:Cgr1 family
MVTTGLEQQQEGQVNAQAPVQDDTKNVPKGRNVSGRSWKTSVQKRASSLVTTKINNRTTSWETKIAEKQLKQQIQQLQKEMAEQKRADILLKRERRLENEKRRAENEYKNIQNASRNVQSLNTAKLRTTLKAMSKKQLRQVKKSQVNTKTGVVEYVPLYGNTNPNNNKNKGSKRK